MKESPSDSRQAVTGLREEDVSDSKDIKDVENVCG
jgi:hypothetical protein